MEITDMNQAEVVSYRYDPYGKVAITRGGTPQSSDPLGNHWTFTGRFLDEETGLLYYRARYYDPVTGRFLQRDPLGCAKWWMPDIKPEDLWKLASPDYRRLWRWLHEWWDTLQPKPPWWWEPDPWAPPEPRPLGVQGGDGPNLFEYAGINPASRSDPSGHNWIEKVGKTIAGAIGYVTCGAAVAPTMAIEAGVQPMIWIPHWISVGCGGPKLVRNYHPGDATKAVMDAQSECFDIARHKK
jgi:RHS repeat-associated protein